LFKINCEIKFRKSIFYISSIVSILIDCLGIVFLNTGKKEKISKFDLMLKNFKVKFSEDEVLNDCENENNLINNETLKNENENNKIENNLINNENLILKNENENENYEINNENNSIKNVNINEVNKNENLNNIEIIKYSNNEIENIELKENIDLINKNEKINENDLKNNTIDLNNAKKKKIQFNILKLFKFKNKVVNLKEKTKIQVLLFFLFCKEFYLIFFFAPMILFIGQGIKKKKIKI
jgi:hypothetical protein